MWLTVGEDAICYPSDEFRAGSGGQHAERYGHTGAAYWLAAATHQAEPRWPNANPTRRARVARSAREEKQRIRWPVLHRRQR